MAVNKADLPKTDRGWQAYLSNIKVGGVRQWLALGGGLSVCLQEGGGKAFQARIRRAGDKNARRIDIGSFPAVSVAEARQRLVNAKSIAKEGRDPAVDQRRKRAGVHEVRTLSALIELYVQRRKGAGRQPKTLASETAQLELLLRKLGDRLLADIEPSDIAAVVRSEAERLRRAGRTGRSANIMLGSTKQMFRQARGWGLVSGANPAAELTRPANETPRHRVLHDPFIYPSKHDPALNEIGILISALRSEIGPLELEQGTRAAIYLSLALGLRAGEVASLEWVAVHLDDTIPTIDVKSSKTRAGVRSIPLSNQVVELLRQLSSHSDKRRKFVFPARSDATRAEHIHPESLSRAFARACEKLSIPGATFHDLRRTLITGLGELTGDDALAKRVAGHKERTTLARHYDQSRRLHAILEPLQRWADALERMREAALEAELQKPS